MIIHFHFHARVYGQTAGGEMMRQIGRYALRIINRSPFKFKHFVIFLLVLLAHWALLSISAKLHILPGTGVTRGAAAPAPKPVVEKGSDGVRQKVFALLRGNDGRSEVLLYARAIEISGLGDRTFEPLLEALHDKNKTVRAIAVETLGEIGDERAVEPLIDALKDSSSLVRKKAAEALGALGDRRAVEALIKAIDDKAPEVSYQAEMSLGKLGDRRATMPLVNALKDINKAYGAADALEKLDDPDSAGLILRLVMNGEVKGYAESAVSHLIVNAGKPAVNYLLGSLRSADKEKRKLAIRSFYALQAPEAVEPLISMLDSDDFDIWLSAIYTLGSYENPSIKEKLFSIMQSSEGKKKLSVACALGLMKDERAVSCILESIDSYDFCVGYSPRVEQVALAAIGIKARPQLVAALKSSDNKETRYIALDVLSEFTSGKELEKLLIETLKDNDGFVRSHAALKLWDCASSDATLPLIDAVKEQNCIFKDSALMALGRTGDPRALDVLVESLHDLQEYTREHAVRALGDLKDARAIKPLSRLLESDDIKVYSNVAMALAEIGDTAFVPRLIEKIERQQWDDDKTGSYINRESINCLAQALGKTGKSSTGKIAALLKGDSWHSHYIAGMALGEIDDPSACAELMKAFKERKLDVIAGAHEFFIRKGIQGSEPILAMALDEYSDFYMAGAYMNCDNSKMKKIAMLDTVRKNYCRCCIKGVRRGIWRDNVSNSAPSDARGFLEYVDMISSLAQ